MALCTPMASAAPGKPSSARSRRFLVEPNSALQLSHQNRKAVERDEARCRCALTFSAEAQRQSDLNSLLRTCAASSRDHR